MSDPIQPPSDTRTCQAAVFVAPGHPLELRSFALPSLEAGEALVRVECCTLCGSDLHTIRGTRMEAAPSILGHEVLGVVDEVGSPPPCDIEGRPLRPGDRITWSMMVSCGGCDRCRGGLPQKCRTLAKYGHELAAGRQALSGGLAEFILLRRGSTVVRIDANLPANVICPVSCATATIAAALREAGQIAGRRVLILGSGMLGVTAAAFAKSEGAAVVVACDVDSRRLQLAGRFGAGKLLDWHAVAANLKTGHRDDAGDLFDIVLELSGAPEAVEAACRLGDVGARVVLVGSVMKARPAAIDAETIVRRWISVHGVHNYNPDDLRAAIAFLQRTTNMFPFAELVEFSYPLADVNAAVQTALRVKPFRVAVVP